MTKDTANVLTDTAKVQVFVATKKILASNGTGCVHTEAYWKTHASTGPGKSSQSKGQGKGLIRTGR